jgi:predicted metalloprotease with PDZ domain
MEHAYENEAHTVDAAFSLGLELKEDGAIADTIEGMPAAVAGIGPGMKLIAVNGRQFSPEVLRAALKAGKDSSMPLELLVENTDYYKTYKVDYHGGERYPHLVRDESKPDLLTGIYASK